MDLIKKVKSRAAQVKEVRSESMRNNMSTADVQTHTLPQDDVHAENVTRKPRLAPDTDAQVQQKGTIARPAATSAVPNVGPTVPPRASVPCNKAKAPGNDIDVRSLRQISRKPTQTEDIVNGHMKNGEKALPPRVPTVDFGSSLPQELFISQNPSHKPQAPDLEAIERREPTLSQAVEEQTMKMQQQAQDMKALRDMNNQHVIEIEKLRVELQKEKEMHAQKTQAWRKATAASLSSNHHQANYKVDDNELRGQYGSIIYGVQDWVSNHCLLKFKHLPATDLNIFSELTTEPSKYFNVKRTRELLLQSLVMHDLTYFVFGQSCWAGRLSGEIRNVEEAVRPGT